MHFITLVTVEVPELHANPIEDMVVEEKLKYLNDLQKQNEKNTMLDINIRMLNGLKTEFARQVYELMYEKMEPYNEQTENPKFLEFEDLTESLQEEYENARTDCIKLPDGRILPADDWIFHGKFAIHEDGKVYQKNFGKLKHDKRSKKAKKMSVVLNYPYKKIYKTLDDFAENYKSVSYNEDFKGYGYTYNPQAFYDWCVIGGRWPRMFLVKNDCAEYSIGERSWCNKDEEYEAPDGYHWVAAARKKDIQWQVMRDWRFECAKKDFYKFEEEFKTGVFPVNSCYYKRGNKLLAYNNILYIEGETLEKYLKRMELNDTFKYPNISYGYLDDSGYHEKEYTWHYGKSKKHIKKQTRKNNIVWRRNLDKFIDSIPDDTVIIGVDCHV